MHPAPRLPRKTRLAAAVERQHGMSLLEVSIGLAAAAALATAVFLIYRPSDVTAAVKQEQSNLQDLSTSVERSYGLLGSFEDVTQGRLLTDRLVPASMLRSDGALRHKWGGAVEVAPETVSSPNDAFAIAYPSVPQEACAQLASSVASGVYDIRIGGVSVFAGGELSPATLATRCNTGNSANMVFVYHSGLVSGEAVATTPVSNPPPVVAPPVAPPSPPGTPVSPPSNPPVIVTPPIIVAPPPGTPVTVAPPVVGPPGTPVVVAPPGTPPGTPTAPPPYTATCQSKLPTPNPANESRAGTAQAQILDCAVNQYGQINQSRPTTESRVVTSVCPGNEPWQDPTSSATAWAVATLGAWTTSSNTCTNCPAPYSEPQTQWVPSSATCPLGQAGTNTWERAQSRSRNISTSCPVGTRTLPAATIGAWSAWTDTGATRNVVNTCAPSCAGGMKWVDLGSSSRTGPAIAPWFPSTPSGFGTATLHPALTPALLASANAARTSAVYTATPPPFDPVGIYFEQSAGGTNSCASPADNGNVTYTRRYSRIPGIGAGMDGGGGVYESWSESYMGCMSACDATTYEPGICRSVNGPGVGSGQLHHYLDTQTTPCSSPLTGNVTSERVGVCAETNSPTIDWSPWYVRNTACSGTIYGRTAVPEPDMRNACGPNNPLPFRPLNSIYGGRCGAGNAGYFFFTSGSTQCVMCPPPMYHETGRFTVPSQTCSGATNYNRVQCPGFDQTFVDPQPFLSSWWINQRNTNCVCNTGNLGTGMTDTQCVDGPAEVVTYTCR